MSITGKSLNVSLGNFSTSPDNFKPNQLLHRIRDLAASYRREYTWVPDCGDIISLTVRYFVGWVVLSPSGADSLTVIL